LARIAAAIYLFVVVAALLHEFGINISALLGAAGVVGFALAYASQTAISNMLSGFFLAVEQPFHMHDIVHVNGIEGTVEGINLFAIKIRTPRGTIMRVPNEQLLKNSFINMTRLPKRRYDFVVRIDPHEDVARVVNLLQDAVSTRGEGVVFVEDITGTFSLIQCNIWVDQKDYSKVQQTLPAQVKSLFERNNVVLAQWPRWEGK
jgi:small-conductance mechanosensitive channel